MKFKANKYCSEWGFVVGTFVYMKLQPYKQVSLANRAFHKLSALYYKPFKILEKIGTIVYKSDLPIGTKIHLVFHVFLLKKHDGPQGVMQPYPLLQMMVLLH